ncbi:putative hydroxymethylpyrimidine transporter CytX [Nakamurella panacisegetis]|uniref:Putative hydroxymethylpyrimidine transporter CytX n=1 Tax=Nakamurella panacisegetis TaxID=1090615 RepID=A0A1H0IPU5_9ACTN|nr:putative hydroxymethylpyrimidine transporter CytX [Nakamurella panacisegetis]
MSTSVSRSSRPSAASSVAPPDEAPHTLTEAAPRTLGLLDQLGLWGNLGVSLLGFAGAVAVLQPSGASPLGLTAAIVAIVTGSVLGGLILGATLVLGARTGAPAMVLLRGLLGAKASFVPTVLNIAQCLGWAVFELFVISSGLQALSRGHLPSWLCVVVAGAVTTGLTLRPLGAIRVLRKYVSVLVVLSMIVLAVGLLRRPTGAITGSWGGFWLAVDAVIALTISWVPLGADYSRHSRSARSAFAGGFLGYGVTQVACLLIGVVALTQLGSSNGDQIPDLFLTLPLGTVAFAILVLRETDQSFANVYSTAVSIQNMAPRWDRRILTVLIGAGTTVLALTVDVSQYENFLYLIGAVFIPLSGALVAGWARSRVAVAPPAPVVDGSSSAEPTALVAVWDVSDAAPVRPGMIAAWIIGFVVYQLINPGGIAGWSSFWTRMGTDLHLIGHPWLSASIASFVVAVLVALPFASPKAGQVSPRQAASQNIHS